LQEPNRYYDIIVRGIDYTRLKLQGKNRKVYITEEWATERLVTRRMQGE